jgi:hypothetical protein
MVLTMIIITVILGGNRTILTAVLAVILGRNRTVLATVLAVILGRKGSGRWRRCWRRSRAIHFTWFALRINHTGFTWLTGLRRFHNNVRLLLLFAFAVKLGVTASAAHEKEGEQKAVNQWFTHLKTS